MKTAIALTTCLLSFATAACATDSLDSANPDPSNPDPTGEVVIIDAQARMLPSSTTDAIALPFDVCSDTAASTYQQLLGRAADPAAVMPAIAGTVATFDARAQTKAVREIEDARVIGFMLPSDGSSHFVLQLAPGSAADLPVETAASDWLATNECANRAENFRITLEGNARSGVNVSVADITGVVHTDAKHDKWIELPSTQFMVPADQGAILRDAAGGPVGEDVPFTLTLETGRPGTPTYMKVTLSEILISSITQNADGTTTGITKAGTGTLTLAGN